MPGYRLRPVAGKDRNPARGRFRQGAGQPGEPLQRDWLGSRHGPAYAVVGRGRTELDAAPCPDREEPAMRASAGQPVRGAARAGLYPLSRFWGTAGPAEVAGGCSRRPERRGWHASRRGKAAHAGRPAAALAACTGHRRPVGAGHRGLGDAWSGVGVPHHLLVPPGGRRGGFWSCWQSTLGSRCCGRHTRGHHSRGRRSRACSPRSSTPRA